MSSKTGIEWTDSTWNPFIGCSRVSEGCRHCYAERLAGRFSAKTKGVYAGTTKAVNGLQVWTGKINRAPEETLLKPLHWRTPRHIFVNSMSDLFHENVPDEWIDRVSAVMALCPQHIFQVLTKRPERMLRYFNSGPRPSTMSCPRRNHILNVTDFMTRAGECAEKYRGLEIALAARLVHGEWKWPLSNVWLGVSVENQAAADERIPLLLRTPAAVRFISAEPLLGLIGLAYRFPHAYGMRDDRFWVICGGESGSGARPMNPDWARSLRDQCAAAGVPFFFKQWGEFAPGPHSNNPSKEIPIHCSTGGLMHHAGKKAAGALLDGREWKQFPEVAK